MVLKGVPTKIRALITDAEGEPVAEKSVTITVVKDSDGSKVVNEASAGKTSKEGIATYELAAQSSLDLLTATWKCEGSTFTTTEQIVGLRLCSLLQVVEDISGESLKSATAETQELCRATAEQFLEQECGVAFRPGYARETLDGSGVERLALSRPQVTSIRSVTLEPQSGETETLTAEELAELRLSPTGVIWRPTPWPLEALNVSVAYEHGYADPPLAARRAAALLARHLITKRPSNLEERATSYSTDEAAYTLILPGVRGMATSIPEVNAFIQSYQFPSIV